MTNTNKRSIFVIRDNTTQTFCTSSKYGHFSDFSDAAIYTSRANAEKALLNVESRLARPDHSLFKATSTHPAFSEKGLVMEVVECALTPLN